MGVETTGRRRVEEGWGWTALARDRRPWEACSLALRRGCDTVWTQVTWERNWRNWMYQHSCRAATSLGSRGQSSIAHDERCDGRIQTLLEKQAGNWVEVVFYTNRYLFAWSFPPLWNEQGANWDLRSQERWGDQHGWHCGGICYKLPGQEEEVDETLNN